jgi:hypothetical protein
MKPWAFTTVLIAGVALAGEETELRRWAERAAGGDRTAIERLREAGAAGLAVLIENHPTAAAAIDAVAGQKDASVSRLYWYTDFEKAKAAARASGRLILSLRLLGNLDEEFSCANSRYFRTVLYANAEVSRVLRERLILHWKSVRPVPKITIDFGDGRVLQRTVTGNSIHYVLDPDGRVIDGLPGLYGPKAFLKLLDAASDVRDVRAFHAAQLQNPVRFDAEDARLDASSRDLMRRKFPDAREAGRIAVTKATVEDPLLRMIRDLERALAEDARQNETVLHRRLHEWFANGEVDGDVERLNDRVYAELFLMPLSDPWLGLAPADVYTALPEGGLRRPGTGAGAQFAP